MKKFTPFLVLILFSCTSKEKLINIDREKINAELNYIGNIDQEYARLPPEELVDKYGNEKAWKIFKAKRDSVGFDNQKRIKNLYSKYGYLGFKEVGEENSVKFWLPIQHADNDVEFQKKMLKELKKQIEKNNAHKSDYALLEDRIAVNTNQKQRFGSQVTYNEDGQAIPKNGLLDSANVDKLRTEYGLPSFKEYYNWMTTSHFEMNKDILQKKGIKEPKLYK